MIIKDLIKSRKLRRTILKCLSFIPDRYILPVQYYSVLGRWPDLRHPRRVSEWIQWYKMHYRNPEMLRAVDKYEARSYVAEKLGTDAYLNQLYQVCDKAEEIDFDSLPQEFVIKTTDGGGGENVMLVKDKSTIDVASVVEKVNSWRMQTFVSVGREWAYVGAKKSRIIVEKLLRSSSNEDGSVDDYKFWCFGGKFRYLGLDKDRFGEHKRAYWNDNLEYMKGVEIASPTLDYVPELPSNITEMVKIVERLAVGFPFVRVDMYNVDSKILFGELTFYPVSGYFTSDPESYEFEMGDFFREAILADTKYCTLKVK